ncbi:uncharacterized protein BKA55DRAFT_527063, partial [Fusarium redolens]
YLFILRQTYKKYSLIIKIALNKLSFKIPAIYKDIYSYIASSKVFYLKSKVFYN